MRLLLKAESFQKLSKQNAENLKLAEKRLQNTLNLVCSVTEEFFDFKGKECNAISEMAMTLENVRLIYQTMRRKILRI